MRWGGVEEMEMETEEELGQLGSKVEGVGIMRSGASHSFFMLAKRGGFERARSPEDENP